MEQLLTTLVQRARGEGAVASQELPNGRELLAYPHGNGVLVGLGFDRRRAQLVHLETVLRRRAEQPARYAAWLPALLADDSWYVFRRVHHIIAGTHILSPDELKLAEELLA